jgi:hypothetical protein
MFNIKTMPDCCWRYLSGINNTPINKKDLQVIILKTFRHTGYQAKDWRPSPKVTGAVLFCGSFGGGAMSLHGNTVDKDIVTKNVEKICQWIEAEDIGDIVELPQFYNGLHTSQILPRMWIINQTKLKQAMKRWYKVPSLKTAYRNEVGASW